MLLLAICPPVFFYVTDPVVEAVERAQNGIAVKGEEDSWNMSMPMSKADKKRDCVVKTYIGTMTAVLTYLTLCGVGK